MDEIDFLARVHRRTPRDYVARVVAHDKAACAEVAKRFDRDYWDGARQYGYGGYHYDGRWRPVAEDIAAHYRLTAGDRVLDIGCGKAFLLYELTQVVPGLEVRGVDVSRYGLDGARSEIRDHLQYADAVDLPFDADSFDLVFSINVLHNLELPAIARAAAEMVRVGRRDAYVCVESYRNEAEKANLLYWQLTCESFHRPEAWKWLLREFGYRGDIGFIYFE